MTHRARRARARWVIGVSVLLGFALALVLPSRPLGVLTGSAPGGAEPVQGPAVGRGCTATERPVLRPEGAPPADSTYGPEPPNDATILAQGVTWRPNLETYPINVDGDVARLCWVGGSVIGMIPDDMTWEAAHDLNQPCIRIVATGSMTIGGLRCENTGDGLRPRETTTGAQNVTMLVHDTYLTRIRDDCLENDGVIGGTLRDNLWDGCNTGISERPSASQGAFGQPSQETLILDHMLIGLAISPHEAGPGENALFKWSDSANRLVIRCSIFKVDAVSLNGVDAMAVPGTVDDRACPDRPSTLVWLGGGPYPGKLPAGMQVTSQVEVWDRAVVAWLCVHEMSTKGCS